MCVVANCVSCVWGFEIVFMCVGCVSVCVCVCGSKLCVVCGDLKLCLCVLVV